MEEISSSTALMKKTIIGLVIIIIMTGIAVTVFYNPTTTEECAGTAPTTSTDPVDNPF
jgi:heme/copper-type cytochrome/quinol oxidase subunit 4